MGSMYLYVSWACVDGYDCVALNREVVLAKKVQVISYHSVLSWFRHE